MSSAVAGMCLRGRAVEIALRQRGREPRRVTLIVPAPWKRAALLKYVRQQHPNETVKIVKWHDSGGWEGRYFLPDPDVFASYERGVLA